MKNFTQQKIQQLQRMCTAAQQAHQSGLIAQAENLYLDVLKQAPEAWDVRQQFAMLLATTGRSAEAAKQFGLIVRANPTYAAGHANLANALAESGRIDDAITEFKRALSLDASLLGARVALGETLRRAARYDEALLAFKEVLNTDKRHHAAFYAMGIVYRDMDDLPRALECFEHAVGLAPKIAEYRMQFGVALRRHKIEDYAAQQLFEAVKLKPDWLEAVVLLAEVLQKQGRYDEAMECFQRALQLSPGNSELMERIGYVYLDMSDTDSALQQFEQVQGLQSDRFMTLLGIGRAYMLAGQTSKAAATLENVIDRFPNDAAGYFYLAASRKFKADDPVIPQLQKLADRTSDQDGAAIDLSFALGKIYDDSKQWDDAWHYYSRGNRLRNAKYDYQPARQEAKFDNLIQVFSQEFIESRRDFGQETNLPVIIVGMPRSGTTLTEQIISSHPQVVGAGEVVFWNEAYEAVPYIMKSALHYPNCMLDMTPEHADKLAKNYEAHLQKVAGPGLNSARITDKMPHNFAHLGLIALLFPNARIIHCKRNALDNCVSIFFQNFGGEHPYAYDLTNLGHHYKQYERLMEHWHKVLPGRIMDINYEDTISDPEYWSRKLIEHVGLEWDDACLAPHQLERTIKTASHWQVRQPIYKTSVQRWKNYENHLEPLMAALGDK